MSYQGTPQMIVCQIYSVLEEIENAQDQESSLKEKVERNLQRLLQHQTEEGATEAFRMTSVDHENCSPWYNVLTNFPDAEETYNMDIAMDHDHGRCWLGGSRHYSTTKKRSL